MSQKNGAIIHVERGYQVAEALEVEAGVVSRFIGYRVLGPGAETLPVFDSEDEALYALAQLVVRYGPRDPA
jgi:hypothetical protein